MPVRAPYPLARVMVATLLLLGVTVALGACDSDASGIKTYTDPDYGYSFEYPAGWVLNKSDTASVGSGGDAASSVQVGNPEGARVGDTGLDGLIVRVYELNQAVDESMLPQVKPGVEALIADLLSQDPSWKVEDTLTETNVGGVPGYRATFTFDWDADHPVKSTSYFLFDGTIEYELAVQAATDTWEANQEVFGAFVASFAPGPASATSPRTQQ